MTEATWGIDSK